MGKTLEERVLEIENISMARLHVSQELMTQLITDQQAHIRELENPWQPIESAPKDGEILVTDGYVVFTAMYRKSNCHNDKPFLTTTANNDFKNTGTDWKQEYEYIPVTHWMPLPQPPKGE